MDGASEPQVSIARAKANLRLAAQECDPRKLITQHPLTSVAVAAAAGYFALRSPRLPRLLTDATLLAVQLAVRQATRR